uniref:Patatin like phospholipase domain containing 1 n=1 Tax=Myotis myotis TaxID=51298 RepID=A0A7J7WXG2_MYOMY|nr:patatin like phospholipase domain containing 1 [Myotis myotis]
MQQPRGSCEPRARTRAGTGENLRSPAEPSPHCPQMLSSRPWPLGDQGDTHYQACWCRGSCFPGRAPSCLHILSASTPLLWTDGRTRTGTEEHAAQPSCWRARGLAPPHSPSPSPSPSPSVGQMGPSRGI